MNILLTVECENKAQDSTFTFISNQPNSLFLQFAPDFYLQGLSLGEIFEEQGIQGVRDFFQTTIQLPVDGSIVIKEQNLFALLHYYFPDGVPHVQSNQAPINPAAFKELVEYQKNLEGATSTFALQQHFLRILKNQLVKKRNLLKLKLIIRQVSQYLSSDISQQQWLKLFVSLVRQPLECEKFIFPLENTYRVLPLGQVHRIKMVDIGKNERLLRNLAQQSLLKETLHV